MVNRYLLEIGTEELPPAFMESVPAELADKVRAALDEQRLSYGDVTVYITPRRIALYIDGLPEKQEATEELHKGPPVRIAFDGKGQPTKAAEAFCRKLGIEVSQAKKETIGGEEYLIHRAHVQGRSTQDLLRDILPEIILNLSGPRFQRWGDYDIRFARPIRWLVSVWNDRHMPFELDPLTSSDTSRGHRFLSEGPVTVGKAEAYAGVMESEGRVIVDHQRRRQMIRDALQQTATRLGGKLPPNEDLLDTVNRLVEYPWVLTGNIDKRFLDIPKEVITTVMAAHQKYFPVEQENGELMPYFLAVSNARPEAEDTIRQGNERVLKARLEDARFFFDDDRGKKLESRLEDLKGITFQKGLGSMYDKTRRLIALAEHIARMLKYDQALHEKTRRAATLAKTDLVTGMVFELTELQGVMGRKYAELEGEPPEVSEALFEQYLPRFMGDAVATQPVGIAVSLADKLDTMVAVFSQEKAKMPTGSKDPLGLRRMANGIILTIILNRLNVNLPELLAEAYQLVATGSKTALAGPDETRERIEAFMLQRLKGILLDQDYRYDIIDAVVDARDPFTDLTDTIRRLQILKVLTGNEAGFLEIYEPANRICRILGDNYNPDAQLSDVNPKYFSDDNEKALFEAIGKVDETADYESFTASLGTLFVAVTRFFDNVLVNDPDENVRQNRYNLLSLLNRFYMRLANFSRLVVSGGKGD